MLWPTRLPGRATPSPCALLSWALYRAELQLAYGYSKAVTMLPCRQRTTSRIWTRNLPGPLVAAADKLLYQATVAVLNPVKMAAVKGHIQGFREHLLLLLYVVCIAYSLQGHKLPSLLLVQLPSYSTATGSSGFPSIPL